MEIVFRSTREPHRLFNLHGAIAEDVDSTALALVHAIRDITILSNFKDSSVQKEFVDGIRALYFQETVFRPVFQTFDVNWNPTSRNKQIIHAAHENCYKVGDIEYYFSTYGGLIGIISLILAINDTVWKQWLAISEKRWVVANVVQLAKLYIGIGKWTKWRMLMVDFERDQGPYSEDLKYLGTAHLWLRKDWLQRGHKETDVQDETQLQLPDGFEPSWGYLLSQPRQRRRITRKRATKAALNTLLPSMAQSQCYGESASTTTSPANTGVSPSLSSVPQHPAKRKRSDQLEQTQLDELLKDDISPSECNSGGFNGVWSPAGFLHQRKSAEVSAYRAISLTSPAASFHESDNLIDHSSRGSVSPTRQSSSFTASLPVLANSNLSTGEYFPQHNPPTIPTVSTICPNLHQTQYPQQYQRQTTTPPNMFSLDQRPSLPPFASFNNLNNQRIAVDRYERYNKAPQSPTGGMLAYPRQQYPQQPTAALYLNTDVSATMTSDVSSADHNSSTLLLSSTSRNCAPQPATSRPLGIEGGADLPLAHSTINARSITPPAPVKLDADENGERRDIGTIAHLLNLPMDSAESYTPPGSSIDKTLVPVARKIGSDYVQ